MADAIVDLIENIAAEEDNGRVVRLTRVALITGVTSDNGPDFVGQMLSATGLPAPGASVSVGDSVLYLKRRVPVMSEDRSQAKVTLEYVPGGTSGEGGTNILRRRGRTAIQQKQVWRDRSGAQIIVEHDGVEQGGTIDVFQPQPELVIETIETTANPESLANAWVGYVNDGTWKGEAAGVWMVSQADYEELDVGNNRWRFIWGFQANRDKWLPVARFTDPETGQPPPGLVPDEGIKAIPYYPERDFSAKF